MIDVQVQLKSAFLSRIRSFDMYNANFGTAWLIQNVPFQYRHASGATNIHLKHSYPSPLCTLYFLFVSFLSCCLWLWFNRSCAPRLSSTKTLHIWMYAAEPNRPLLITQSMLDGYMKATAKMDWTVSSMSTVDWTKVALHSYTTKAQTWPFRNLT
jgi:hypothetical protein